MKGIDTNVLVRYLTADDAEQTKTASACIHQITTSEESCYINTIVLCELVWVLESAYHLHKKDIAGVLEKILTTRQFEIENKDIVRLALEDYKEGKADFADYVIGRMNSAKGCELTYTFDRSLGNHDAFVLLKK